MYIPIDLALRDFTTRGKHSDIAVAKCHGRDYWETNRTAAQQCRPPCIATALRRCPSLTYVQPNSPLTPAGDTLAETRNS